MKNTAPATLDISGISRIVNLIKKVNCETYAFVSEAAKELGVKKTDLMQFIEDNPKLFSTKEHQKGLTITTVYTSPEQNPDTPEWLEMKKEEWANKIQVFGQYYYGVLQFHYIAMDEGRKALWRNTQKKIQTLIDAGAIKKVKTRYGGIGDCFDWEGYKLDIKSTELIKELGWELVYPD